jgi:hypothetical protein
MRDHLVLAATLVKAAKAGNSQAAAEAEKKWYTNADEIAVFSSFHHSFFRFSEVKMIETVCTMRNINVNRGILSGAQCTIAHNRFLRP